MFVLNSQAVSLDMFHLDWLYHALLWLKLHTARISARPPSEACSLANKHVGEACRAFSLALLTNTRPNLLQTTVFFFCYAAVLFLSIEFLE